MTMNKKYMKIFTYSRKKQNNSKITSAPFQNTPFLSCSSSEWCFFVVFSIQVSSCLIALYQKEINCSEANRLLMLFNRKIRSFQICCCWRDFYMNSFYGQCLNWIPNRALDQASNFWKISKLDIDSSGFSITWKSLQRYRLSFR